MSEYVVAGEIVKIHTYLMRAPKLKYIVGGSTLIETFSTSLVKKVAKKMGGNIYAAAAGRFLVGFTDKEKSKTFLEVLRYIGTGLFGEDIFLICGPLDPDGEGSILDKVRDALEEMKQSANKKPSSAIPGLQSMSRCEACGSWGTIINDGENKARGETQEKTEICPCCQKKLAARNGDIIKLVLPTDNDWGMETITIGGEVTAGDSSIAVPYAKNPHKTDPGITSFEKIAERSSPPYLALFYADGNSMGEILHNSQNLSDYKKMSDELIKANTEALEKAVLTVSADGKFPGLVLIKGGDDLLVALPADRAVTFSRVFLESAIEGKGTPFREGICGGLILSKPQMPFTILYKKAEELLSSSKRQIWRLEKEEKKCPRDKTSIDFAMITSPLLEALGNTPERKTEEIDGMIHATKTILEEPGRATVAMEGASRHAMFTARPYLIEEYIKLIDGIKEFKKLNLPSRVFMDLKEICLPSSENLNSEGAFAKLDTFVGRLKKLYGKQVEDFFNGKVLKYNTWEIKGNKALRQWQADIIEITDFVK